MATCDPLSKISDGTIELVVSNLATAFTTPLLPPLLICAFGWGAMPAALAASGVNRKSVTLCPAKVSASSDFIAYGTLTSNTRVSTPSPALIPSQRLSPAWNNSLARPPCDIAPSNTEYLPSAPMATVCVSVHTGDVAPSSAYSANVTCAVVATAFPLASWPGATLPAYFTTRGTAPPRDACAALASAVGTEVV